MNRETWKNASSEGGRGEERRKMWISERRIEMDPESEVMSEETSYEQIEVTLKETSSFRKRGHYRLGQCTSFTFSIIC